MNIFVITSFLILSFSISARAYDPCDVDNSFNKLAESECFRIQRDLPLSNESFILSAVLMTKDLATQSEKTTMILIPGGPGGDSQGLRMSLDQKDMLNAFWAHLNLNVVAYDPRGTGNSQLPREAHHYPQDVFYTSNQVDDLKAVIEATSPEKPVLLFAHSAGGNLAARLAYLYPDRVKGLILYSASIDTREIGESNLRIFAKDFPFFQSRLSHSCPLDDLNQLDRQRRAIESFLRNALKVKRLLNDAPTALRSRFYLKDFRVELIKAIENDLDCSTEVPQLLNLWSEKIRALPVQTREYVMAQEELQFDPTQHQPPRMNRGVWIRTAVICAEGITKSEALEELWLEGLNFSQDTCFGVEPLFETPPARDWLAEISTPTLLLGGSRDPFQIPSAVRRNARAIENSRLIFFEGGGHEAHLTHPMEFFNTMDSFINSL